MITPRLPASWYTLKGAVIATLLALGATWLAGHIGGALGVMMGLPIIAGALAVPIIVLLEWITGRGQRAYRFGTGRQDAWGYLGHTIRGQVDGQTIWLSVVDCETASGLNLSSGLKSVPTSGKRRDDVKGIMLDMPSMIRVLGQCTDDLTQASRFRAFLERTVWKTRRG